LIDRFVEFKMLGVQTERLADIVLTKPEESFAHRKHDLPEDLTLVMDKVSYRYSKDEPYLLSGASLEVKQGECIAIVGPSGCGKSTCLKLMLARIFAGMRGHEAPAAPGQAALVGLPASVQQMLWGQE
jgi:ATP-binding cassette subfamily B protein RaxB